jgi:hypothetical protein
MANEPASLAALRARIEALPGGKGEQQRRCMRYSLMEAAPGGTRTLHTREYAHTLMRDPP